jgi:gamma-glutamyltranspeptidase/glutathione hydrolase
VQYRHGDLVVMGSPLPTFGAIAVGQLLGVAARHGVFAIGDDLSAQEIHILVEASRLAFADRAAYAGDPDLHPINEPALLAPAYLDARAALLNPRRRSSRMHAGTTADGSMTSHLSIADAAGQVVSMTTTINQNFGARLSVGGFYLNNVMTNFADTPNEGRSRSINAMAPQARPRTSIAPCIVFDQKGVLAAIGAGGGGRIIGYAANALLRLASGLRDPQAILSAPHALNSAGIAELEPPLDRHAKALAAMGHWVTLRRHDGGAQAIIRHDAGWSAGADPRRDGVGLASD